MTPGSIFSTWACVMAWTPRSRKSDSVQSLLVVSKPRWLKVIPPPEITEFVFVGQIGDVGELANSRHAKFVLHVEAVFKRRPFTGTRAVSDAHDQTLAFPRPELRDDVVEVLGRFDRVGGCADRDGVGIGTEANTVSVCT